MIDVTALGGIGEYGRNCFIVTDSTTNTRVMLDCGVRNSNPEVYPPITEEIAQSVQAVFISHVHNDHIGALPLLVKKGFKGDVWMSEGSFRQLAAIKKLSLKNIHFRYFMQHTRGKPISFTKNFSITWGYSGHMLGSVWYTLQFHEKSIFFSGDMVLDSLLLATDMPDKSNYDLALIDSGHAAQTMSYEASLANISAEIRDTSKKYLLPITISGKACDLLFSLFQALPSKKFFIDYDLHEHLLCYLNYPDNIRKEHLETFKAMLHSERLAINNWTEEPGIYLLRNKSNDYHQINTNQGDSSFFYKSHPDKEDIRSLLSRIKAKEYIFFHSKQTDLEHLLETLDSEKIFGRGVV